MPPSSPINVEVNFRTHQTVEPVYGKTVAAGVKYPVVYGSQKSLASAGKACDAAMIHEIIYSVMIACIPISKGDRVQVLIEEKVISSQEH